MFISNQTKPGADQSAFSQPEGGMGTIQSISTPTGTMKLICLPASSSGATSGVQGVQQLVSVRSNGNTVPTYTAQTVAQISKTGRQYHIIRSTDNIVLEIYPIFENLVGSPKNVITPQLASLPLDGGGGIRLYSFN